MNTEERIEKLAKALATVATELAYVARRVADPEGNRISDQASLLEVSERLEALVEDL